MTKDTKKHILIAATTILAFLATFALMAFIFVKLGIASLFVHLFLKSLSGVSPSGLAAGGVLFFGITAVAGALLAPFVAAWYTQKKLSKLCWGDPNFYWNKTPMAQKQKQTKEANLAKQYHAILVSIENEQEAIRKEKAQQETDPEPFKQAQEKRLEPSLLALKNLLENQERIASPEEYRTHIQQCTQAKEQCILARKQFKLSTQ